MEFYKRVMNYQDFSILLKQIIRSIKTQNEYLMLLYEIAKTATKLDGTHFFISSYSPNMNGKNFPKSHSIPVGIILQGPLPKNKKFLLETIRIYNQNFSMPRIFVSTWENEDAAFISKISKLENITVVLNKRPVYDTPDHFNSMVCSVLNSLKKMKELGIQYIMRTRTDQRIILSNSDLFFLSLLKQFPLTAGKQKERIITINFYTLLYIPFHISDMFQFGHTCKE